MLVHVFVGRIKKQLIVLLVEVGTRNQYRTAKVAAGIVKAVRRRLQTLAVEEPPIGVKHAIARIEISLSMEMRAATLANHLERDGTFGEFCAVGVSQNRNLLDLVHVDVGGLSAIAAGIRQVGSIRCDCQGAEWGPLGGKGADGAIITLRRHRTLPPHALAEPRSNIHARHDLDQFGRIAPGDRNVLDHVLVQRLARLSGIDRHYYIRAGHHLNLLLCGLHLENDRRQTQSRTLCQNDALFFKGLQTLRGYRNSVGCRQDRREIEVSCAVRNGFAQGAGSFVFEDGFRLPHHRSRRVGNRGADRPARELRECARLRKRQRCHL